MRKLLWAFVGLWAFNALIVLLCNFSPLYCWGGLLTGPLWKLWAEMALIAGMLLFIGGMVASKRWAFIGVSIMVIASSAPEFSRILFGMGGRC